jgi:hypothetical protein
MVGKAAIERPVNGVLIDSGSMRVLTPRSPLHLFDTKFGLPHRVAAQRGVARFRRLLTKVAEMSFARGCCFGSPT